MVKRQPPCYSVLVFLSRKSSGCLEPCRPERHTLAILLTKTIKKPRKLWRRRVEVESPMLSQIASKHAALQRLRYSNYYVTLRPA